MKVKAMLRLGFLCGIVLLALGGKQYTAIPKATSKTELSGIAPLPFMAESQKEATVPAASVYVCKSAGAKKYHYKNTCRGLSNCKHEIVKMEKGAAENRGLGLCGWED